MLALTTAMTVIGLGATMAFASPSDPPKADSGHHELKCNPDHPSLGGGCQLQFKDGNESKGYGGKAANANQTVCFTVDNPADHVYGQSGNCSLTDSKGNAYAVLQVNACGSATVTATEGPEPGEPAGTATKSVVTSHESCPPSPKPKH